LADSEVDPPVVTRSPRLGGRHRRIGPALRARRRLRAGIVQLVHITVAIAFGVLIPRISVGISVPTSRATEMRVAVGAGFVPFIGIVYSMLFLVVQFGSTTFTPRLNLFRDDPIVWHGFSFFTAVIVFAFTAVFAIGSGSEATLLVPIFLGIAILAAIALLRSLQTAAFRSIQLASILEQVSQRGREVIEGVHPKRLAASDRSGGLSNARASPVVETPSDGREFPLGAVAWHLSHRQGLQALPDPRRDPSHRRGRGLPEPPAGCAVIAGQAAAPLLEEQQHFSPGVPWVKEPDPAS
jgi:hypothetical protein